MTMGPKQPFELYYDSEATLRLVDSAIQELGELAPESPRPLGMRLESPGAGPGTASSVGLMALSDALARGYADILGVLDSLRHSRHLLERAAVERIHQTHDKLREVSSTTEMAATDILNGLDRANAVVDDLDGYAAAHGEPDERGASLRTALREELFALFGHMQFQDITNQQLTYASAVLSEMESRLANIVRVFDSAGTVAACSSEAGVGMHDVVAAFDPDASTRNRAERQAVADAVVATATAP